MRKLFFLYVLSVFSFGVAVESAKQNIVGPFYPLSLDDPYGIEIEPELKLAIYKDPEAILQNQQIMISRTFPIKKLANILLILSLSALLFLFLRYLQQRALEPEQIIKKAKKKALKRLEKLVFNEGGIEPYFETLSTTIRVYIEERYGLAATQKTTSEILNSKELKEDKLDLVKQVLTLSDLVKFSRYFPSEKECLETREKAMSFVIDERGRETERSS